MFIKAFNVRACITGACVCSIRMYQPEVYYIGGHRRLWDTYVVDYLGIADMKGM